MLFEFEDRFALFDMTPVDNQFIQEYLPAARGDDVRVYLYGLMRCYHPEKDMSLDQMSHDLGIPREEIDRAYRYWERKGLVRRVSDDPPAYQYVSLRRGTMAGDERVIDPEYEAFAESLYGVFDNGRRLHGSEIRTCYEWVEDLKIPQEAVIMLLKQMERQKGPRFTIQSAEQTALQMAKENIHTVEDAEEFLSRDQAVYNGTKAVLRKLGKRNQPSEGQMAMYRKWTEEWEFTPEDILDACAETAKGDPSMGYLDGILQNIHNRAKPADRSDGERVARARKESRELKKILSGLENHTLTNAKFDWYEGLRAEYPEKMIELAAGECGRTGGTTEDVGKLLESWRKKGIRTAEDAEAYIQVFRAQSELLLELRTRWGLPGRMGAKDREMVSAWEKELGFSREAILEAAEGAAGAAKPMLYLDRILRSCAEKNIRTVEEIRLERENFKKQNSAGSGGKKQVSAQQYEQRDYSGQDESAEDLMNRLIRRRKTDA